MSLCYRNVYIFYLIQLSLFLTLLYLYFCLISFLSISVHWLKKKAKLFEPTYLYTMEKVCNSEMYLLVFLKCSQFVEATFDVASVIYQKLLFYIVGCVVLFCRDISCYLKVPSLIIIYVLSMLAYQLGTPASETSKNKY